MSQVTGGCHCGAVQVSAELDLSAVTYRCNCSICRKSRNWIAPVAAVEVTQGAEDIRRYRFGPKKIAHCFCKICGVKVFGQSDDGAALSVAALDLTAEQFAGLSVTYVDGLQDRFTASPAVTSYL